MNSTDLYAMCQKVSAKINAFCPLALTQPVSVFGISAVHLETKYLNQWCFHQHQFDELNFILSGKATYCFENGEKTTIQANQWLLVPSGQSHRIFQADQNTLKVSVLFSFSKKENKYMHTYLENRMKRHTFFAGSTSERLMKNIYSICENVSAKDTIHQTLVWNDIVSLIFNVIGEIHSQKRAEAFTAPLPQTDDQRYIAAIQYIKDNCLRPVRVSEVATHCSISQKQLNRLFQNYLQCSVVQYIQQQRLSAAQKKLLSDNRPLYLVSNELGFCDEFYFSRFFTKMMKISPMHYREIHNTK